MEYVIISHQICDSTFPGDELPGKVEFNSQLGLPKDCVIWSVLKEIMYKTKPETVEEVKHPFFKRHKILLKILYYLYEIQLIGTLSSSTRRLI